MNRQSRVTVGDNVAWRTELRGPRFTGVAIGFRKSENRPWHVFVVRRSDGQEIEVHPDRLVKDTEPRAVTCEFCGMRFTTERPNAGVSSRDYHADCEARA